MTDYFVQIKRINNDCICTYCKGNKKKYDVLTIPFYQAAVVQFWSQTDIVSFLLLTGKLTISEVDCTCSHTII